MQTIHLEITDRDYTLILGALAECVAAIEGWELALRVGGDADELATVSEKIRTQGERQGARQ